MHYKYFNIFALFSTILLFSCAAKSQPTQDYQPAILAAMAKHSLHLAVHLEGSKSYDHIIYRGEGNQQYYFVVDSSMRSGSIKKNDLGAVRMHDLIIYNADTILFIDRYTSSIYLLDTRNGEPILLLQAANNSYLSVFNKLIFVTGKDASSIYSYQDGSLKASLIPHAILPSTPEYPAPAIYKNDLIVWTAVNMFANKAIIERYSLADQKNIWSDTIPLPYPSNMFSLDTELYVFVYGEKKFELFKYSLETGALINKIPLETNDEQYYAVLYNNGKFYFKGNASLNCINTDGKIVWKYADPSLYRYFFYSNNLFLIDCALHGWDKNCYIYTLNNNLKPGNKESWYGALNYFFIPDESNGTDTTSNRFLVFNNMLYW